MVILFEKKSVDNFKIAHKTCSSLVWGGVPLNKMTVRNILDTLDFYLIYGTLQFFFLSQRVASGYQLH